MGTINSSSNASRPSLFETEIEERRVLVDKVYSIHQQAMEKVDTASRLLMEAATLLAQMEHLSVTDPVLRSMYMSRRMGLPRIKVNAAALWRTLVRFTTTSTRAATSARVEFDHLIQDPNLLR